MAAARSTEPSTEAAPVTPPAEAGPPVVQLAEGAATPSVVAGPPPTPEDVAYEWQTYRAVVDLPYHTAIAVGAGNPVPASHPLRKQWQKDGMVEYVGEGTETDPA